jgi:hypothetical protein
MIRSLTILLTLVLNAFLSITLAGEDNYLWRYEVDTVKDIISSGFNNIKLFSGYAESLPLTSLLSLFGQLILCSSFLFKEKAASIIKAGIIILWVALGALMVRGLLFFLLLKALPFITVSIVLYWLANKQKAISKMTNR